MKAVMIIIVAACGSMGSGGSGCGVDIDHIEFESIELCEAAAGALFTSTKFDAWDPKREIECVKREE